MAELQYEVSKPENTSSTQSNDSLFYTYKIYDHIWLHKASLICLDIQIPTNANAI